MSKEISKSQYSSQYDNITSGAFYLYNDLGGYIYKSYESMRGASAKFKDHIKPVAECNVGAHYYVQSPYKNYSSAKATIDFNTISLTHKGRNAYISLGLVTEGSKYFSFDIGFTFDTRITNGTEKGWVPYAIAHENNSSSSTTPRYTLFGSTDNSVTALWDFNKSKYKDARYCDIEISVSKENGDDIVKVIYTYRSTSGTVASCGFKFSFTAGEMFNSESTTPRLRFMRFISLVPTGPTKDDADNSSFNAGLSNLKLDGSNWTASQIDYAWSIQGANISELKISTLSGTTSNADSIKINHRYQLH